MRRLALPLAMIAAGVGLLVGAQLAGASGAKYGGIFRYGTTGASVQIDPQVAYITTAWGLEYATAAKLYNYPDEPGRPGRSRGPRSRRASRSRMTGERTRSPSARASASATARR